MLSLEPRVDVGDLVGGQVGLRPRNRGIEAFLSTTHLIRGVHVTLLLSLETVCHGGKSLVGSTLVFERLHDVLIHGAFGTKLLGGQCPRVLTLSEGFTRQRIAQRLSFRGFLR